MVIDDAHRQLHFHKTSDVNSWHKSGISKHGAHSAVRSVDPNKAFPVFGSDETLEQVSPLRRNLAWLSDNRSSRFSCYRFNVAFMVRKVVTDACRIFRR
jgi:hypothetical protein